MARRWGIGVAALLVLGAVVAGCGSTHQASDASVADARDACAGPPPSDECTLAGDCATSQCVWSCEDGEWQQGSCCILAACNPVVQSGCICEQKCTWILDSAGPPPLGYTGCAFDGDKQPGAACTRPEVGYDDCVAGSYYLDGTCLQICDTADDQCPSGYACTEHADFMSDQSHVGVCQPTGTR